MPFANMKVPAGTLSAEQKKHAVDAVTDLYVEFYGEQARPNVLVLIDEVVDLFHFLISMAQVLGMSADDVFNAYVKKNEVNFKRQDTGYAVKDEADSKHI